MNKGLYFHSSPYVLVWYKSWKNPEENFGASVHLKNSRYWTWQDNDLNPKLELIGATCLAQW